MSTRVLRIIVVSILTLIPTILMADTAPNWVSKGVKKLNKERTNDSYQFVKLNTHGLELISLQNHGKDALIKYVEDNYYAQPMKTTIETLREIPTPQYKVTYTTGTGNTDFVIARLIDTYSTFDDFEENAYEFEYYQLYAISNPNTIPNYDEVKLTDTYRGQALARSIIPGMGQIYKGQKEKGWSILVGEIGLAAAAVVFNGKESYCASQKKGDPFVGPSWQSKERAWRNFKYGAIGAAGVLYIYNLIDAVTSKGARKVNVTGPETKVQVYPYASPINAGMTVTLNF